MTNNSDTGVEIRNRHREKIGEGFVHLEDGNIILTGYVDDGAYSGDIATAGLSIGFDLSKSRAREIDGVAYYKEVTINEVSLTPNPANKGAKVTGVREAKEEKEENTMTENTTMIELLAEEKVKAREAQVELAKVREQLEGLQKFREAETPVETPAVREREAIEALGAKMKELPENGFFKSMQREATGVTNQGDLAVSNTLAGLTGKYAKKSGIFDSAFKARFAGMTLGEDGVEDSFLEGMFEAGDDKKRKQTVGKRSILPKMAEAYLEMDKATVANANDVGALSEYVMSIIPNRVIQKIEYNMMYGTKEGANGIYGLFTDHSTKWTKALTYTKGEAGAIYNGLRDAVAQASISDNIRIAMSPQTYAELRKEVGTDKHPIFEPLASRQQVAQALGATDIDIRVWIKEGDIAVWNPTEFVLTGNFTMENFTDFDLRYNVNQWLAEMLVGGSISGLNRSAVLTASAPAK